LRHPQTSARVVIAPDSFKGSATAAEVAAALAEGWRSVRPDDEVVELPLADGGEGTLEVFAAALPGARHRTVRVTGPDGREVDAGWLALPDGTAVVELACASGLPLMTHPDPLGAQTVGLGEVAAAALDAGARRLVTALGGSASTDAGSGALAALGARFLDPYGRSLPAGGGALADLARIDLVGLRPPPPGGVLCLVDVDAPLLGPRGAAAVFGPQKGAGPADIARLERGLARVADLLGGDPAAPGAGAAGGTAYGLAAAWRATLVPGVDTVAACAGLPAALAGADVVVTGEGRFDTTSLSGKVVGGVVRLAASAGPAAVPVLLVAGQLADVPPAQIRRAVALADLAGDAAPAVSGPRRWLVAAAARLARSSDWHPSGIG
jgi:glycerate kinase